MGVKGQLGVGIYYTCYYHWETQGVPNAIDPHSGDWVYCSVRRGTTQPFYPLSCPQQFQQLETREILRDSRCLTLLALW